jgi:hypothetical protein
LTLTQAYKIFLEPEKITLPKNEIQKLIDGDGVVEVEIDGSVINYNL